MNVVVDVQETESVQHLHNEVNSHAGWHACRVPLCKSSQVALRCELRHKVWIALVINARIDEADNICVANLGEFPHLTVETPNLLDIVDVDQLLKGNDARRPLVPR